MELIQISHLSKTYFSKKTKKIVLEDLSFTLPQVGMVFILGKSGSGKSTLLNIIGGIDKPTDGSLSFVNFPKVQKASSFHNKQTYIFQNYHLLEEETSLFNVMLPSLIKGEKTHIAKKKAYELFKKYNFNDELINKKVNLLSGGEKERVAVLRSLISNPSMILADEPTGALDFDNSVKTMEILKEVSLNKLVLVVTHNKILAEKYADRIITLSDGKIESDEVICESEKKQEFSKIKRKSNDYWLYQIISHNFLKRLTRNLVSIFSMSFSLLFALLMIGFSFNYENAVSIVSKKHLDYGSCTVSKEIKKDIEKSQISLIKSSKPTKAEMSEITSTFTEFTYLANYDGFQSSFLPSINGNEENSFTPAFVYDFNPIYYDKNLLINGRFPIQGTNEIVINKQASKYLLKTYGKDIGMKIRYSGYYENSFFNESDQKQTDVLEFDQNFKIVGVVDELDFLSSSKFYLSYVYFDNFYENQIMEKYSSYKGEEFSWKRLAEESKENDKNSSYSYRLFLKDYKYVDSIEKLSDYLSKDIVLYNNALEVKEAMYSFVFATDLGLKTFLAIVLIGSVLIISIFNYTAYSDDKKNTAILSCYGAKKSEISSIFITESLIIGVISFFIALVCSILLQNPINSLIFSFTGISGIINIPFKVFLGRRYLFPITVFVTVVMVSILSSIIPMLFSKRVSIREELTGI